MSREFSLCFVRALKREIPILANTLVLSPQVSQPHVVDKRDWESGFAWNSLSSVRNGWGRPRQASRLSRYSSSSAPFVENSMCQEPRRRGGIRLHEVEQVSSYRLSSQRIFRMQPIRLQLRAAPG